MRFVRIFAALLVFSSAPFIAKAGPTSGTVIVNAPVPGDVLGGVFRGPAGQTAQVLTPLVDPIPKEGDARCPPAPLSAAWYIENRLDEQIRWRPQKLFFQTACGSVVSPPWRL